jgi:hypothetical protein
MFRGFRNVVAIVFKVFFTYKYIKIIFFIFKKFIFDTNTSKYLKIQIKKSKFFFSPIGDV